MQKKCERLLQEHFDGHSLIYESEARMRHRNGKLIWVYDQGKVVSWKDDQPEWMNAYIKETKIKIENKVASDVKVLVISAYLESIIFNFVINAIKYRSLDRAPKLSFRSKYINSFVMLEIQDNGLGIDLEKHGHKLFGMYKTFHKHKEARGIGLFITKNQIEAMGGKIEVESTPNIGTTFKIFLKHA